MEKNGAEMERYFPLFLVKMENGMESNGMEWNGMPFCRPLIGRGIKSVF